MADPDREADVREASVLARPRNRAMPVLIPEGLEDDSAGCETDSLLDMSDSFDKVRPPMGIVDL